MASPPRPEAVRVRVTRDLGLFDVTMAASGTMVGAAVFLLAGATFAVAGPLTFGSILFAGFVVALSGLAYAELASGREGASGGAYEWVRSALPAPSGFLAGWSSWGGHLAASALSALGLGAFLLELLRPSAEAFLPIGLDERVLALVLLAVATGFHFARLHVPARTLSRLTFVKILLILGVAAVGLASLAAPAADRGIGTPSTPSGALGLALGAGVFFIAFQGFESVVQLGEQTKQPARTVPRGILLAVLLSLGVYLAYFAAVLTNAPTAATSGWPGCPACAGGTEDLGIVSLSRIALGGPFWREIFLLVGVASMAGALNANLTSAVRVAFGMSRDRLLPASLSHVGGREVPVVGLAMTAGVTAILLAFSLETIAILAGLAFLLLFAFVHGSVISLRRRERRSRPGFRVPLVPAVPILAIALNLALGAVLWNYPAPAGGRMPAGVLAAYIGAVWLAAGLIFHWFAGGREALRRTALVPKVEVEDVLTPTEDHVELERFRVFLPLREFEDLELVDLGARIARARHGELSLLNVVEIPRNLPPKAIRFRFVDDRIKGLQRLARVGMRLGVDTRPVVKIGHKVYEIILDTMRDEAVNVLVMGWRGGRTDGAERRILGSNIDYLIENATCDVVVYKTHGLRRPLKKLVILTSPIWSILGIDELALVLAESDLPTIEIVSLAADPSDAERIKKEVAPFLETCHSRGIAVEHKVLYSTQWESVALHEGADASALLIRASSPGGLKKFTLNPVEDRIVKLAPCPVLILKKGTS
ncbi:MAG: hypothetical protein A3K66_07650 [Euryarchaeota archaeon RBG_16_67_27]|nr:MAG: hypothetical protein A3K66_07650 [Euryarchaeota archaeon RBG_16_67_27]